MPEFGRTTYKSSITLVGLEWLGLMFPRGFADGIPNIRWAGAWQHQPLISAPWL